MSENFFLFYFCPQITDWNATLCIVRKSLHNTLQYNTMIMLILDMYNLNSFISLANRTDKKHNKHSVHVMCKYGAQVYSFWMGSTHQLFCGIIQLTLDGQGEVGKKIDS